jgi:hypothetical protein
MSHSSLGCAVAALVLSLGAAPGALAIDTANPDASPDAKKILNYLPTLRGYYDRRVIAGQQFGPGEDAGAFAAQVEKLRDPAGKWVALLGADYGYAQSNPQSGGEPSVLNPVLIRYWKSGGLVTIAFHARNPWTGGSAWDTSMADLKDLVTPGTRANAAWMKELDRAADGLAQLRDAGVVVLWRPFEGANGSQYWWGRRGEDPAARENFVNAWKHMFHYFTATRGLNNLLWVYAADSAAMAPQADSFFPGAEYCDIVGLDKLTGEGVWQGYNEIVRLGKPFGAISLGSGEAPDYAALLVRMRNHYPQTAFFLIESDGWRIADRRNAASVLRHPWAMDREELDWAELGRSRWRQAGKLAVRKTEVLTRDPACWKRLDLRVDLSASFDTPFDPDQIAVDALFTTPSGHTMTVPAFFYQNFERQVWGRPGRTTQEVMTEAGPGEWRVRFMPAEAGRYSVSIRARDRSGTVTGDPASFTAAPGTGHGYIHVSKKTPHYFEFDDGTPFFANGLNIVEHPLSEYYRYIPSLGKAGGNYARLWLGFEYLGLEFGYMGSYRLDNAWQLDQIMALSEEYGIHQKFTIDYIRNITPRGLPRRNFDREDYAYSVSNGGPCSSMRDFFTLPEARRLFKNRLRYIVARWAYSPNVAAWELWNEIDDVDPAVRDPAIIVPWTGEMCAYLKSIDPWQHMTTNSLGGPPRGGWADMWRLKEVDFAQRHGYYSPRPGTEGSNPDMAGNVLQWLDAVSDFGKPYMMAEFGLQRDRMDIRALCDRDQEGVNLHNGIWAAIAHGAAGTAQLWWWGQYVDPKNLYFHYRAVANFVKDIPWTTAGFEKADVVSSDEGLRAVGLHGNPVSILWLHNKAHIWWNVINEVTIPPVERAEVTLSGCAPGPRRVEYWDTWDGRIAEVRTIESAGGKLRIPVPPVQRDIAIKVF